MCLSYLPENPRTNPFPLNGTWKLYGDSLARTVAEHCSSMNTEHSVSKKDASLKAGDFSSLKTLKLNEFDDLNPVSR